MLSERLIVGLRRWERRGGRERREKGVERPYLLWKWLLLSSAIGLVAGLGAIAFFEAIHLASAFFLGVLIGYRPPDPTGEGSTVWAPLWGAARPWLLPLVTTGGGLLAGLIVFLWAPEAEGHGTDAAIAAFHQGRPIRARVPLIKLVASAITIGSGGSGGREGPAAQISAGFGSLLATLLHLEAHERRLAIATGIGAGIGAIFRAPLGGAVLAAEILYKDDLEVEALLPALIASIVGYSVFGAFSGWSPIFAVPANLAFSSPLQLFWYGLLGVGCGLVGRAYATGFYGLTALFHRLPFPRWLKPALGGLLVGLIGLAVPQVLGMGYGWVQLWMQAGLSAWPLWVLLALPFLKILATGLSIGSGGSGGIFGPGMVIGAAVGAAFWRLLSPLAPGLPAVPAPFVIVAMMALFGGIAHAPLAVMLMVAEMTGNLSLLAPAMLAVGVAVLTVGEQSIYSSQLKTRADSPAHRRRWAFPLLSLLQVRQALLPPEPVLPGALTLSQAESLLRKWQVASAAVIDEQGAWLGRLTLAQVLAVEASERERRRVTELLESRQALAVAPTDPLDQVLAMLVDQRYDWLPVVEERAGSRRLLGYVSARSILRAYQAARTAPVPSAEPGPEPEPFASSLLVQAGTGRESGQGLSGEG
ncbi:chloride channel protein [Thermogemmatispora carboxidivorans]|uniref:chloride channel protein n=1 Tax=Thermogemmatispora carboxidivorans TaxID=1382306 RepID=UPI0009DDFF78|nr:chloride channel protein [Thermogemmatispora carboxidivorans]